MYYFFGSNQNMQTAWGENIDEMKDICKTCGNPEDKHPFYHMFEGTFGFMRNRPLNRPPPPLTFEEKLDICSGGKCEFASQSIPRSSSQIIWQDNNNQVTNYKKNIITN